MARRGTRSLLDRTVDRLDRAARTVQRHAKEQSSGIDRVTAHSFFASWKKQKEELVKQLRADSYAFSPYLGVAVPKDGSKPRSKVNVRPISIPTIRDRVVQRAMLGAIWTTVRNRVHTSSSYGGLPRYSERHTRASRAESAEKSVRRAIQTILELRLSGNDWLFESDLKNFFSTIDRDKLLAIWKESTDDRTMDRLMESAVRADIGNRDKLGSFASQWTEGGGVAQGGVLSPLLANLYLFHFDQAVDSAETRLVRYVDDFVIACKSESAAQRVYGLVQKQCDQLELSIHPLGQADDKGREKTRIVPPGGGFTFLGVNVNGLTVTPTDKKIASLFEKLTAATDVRGELSTFPEVVRATNAVTGGWISAFSFCDIPESLLNRIDRQVYDRLGGWLKHHGVTKNRNVISPAIAKVMGYRSSRTYQISPISCQLHKAGSPLH